MPRSQMAFKESEAAKILAQCHRRCCVCHKFCGVNIEIHHIQHRSKGGSDEIVNAIPLCFECHAEVNHYNPTHPKGRKFSETELTEHKKQWLEICKKKPEALVSAPRAQDIGPLEGMLLELKFNKDVVDLEQSPTAGFGRKFGCRLRDAQYDRAVTEGAILLLPDSLKGAVNRAYIEVGKVNTFVELYTSTRPDGNAHAEATSKLVTTIREASAYITEAFERLQSFLKPDEGEGEK